MFKRRRGNENSSYSEPLACKDYRYIIELERYIRHSEGILIKSQKDTEWPEIRSRLGHRRGPLNGYI
jgi:hypothetical protein